LISSRENIFSFFGIVTGFNFFQWKKYTFQQIGQNGPLPVQSGKQRKFSDGINSQP
jgi:hypothetical protein